MANKTDPIGDLFAPGKPAAKPSAGGCLSFVAIAFLLAVLGLAVVNRSDWFGGGDHKQDQHEEKQDDKKTQPDDDKKQAVTVKPGYLYVIRDRQFPTIEQNESWELVESFAKTQTDVSARDIDDKDLSGPVQSIVAFAKSKGIDPPFVAYKPKGGELRGVIKLPSKESELMGVFK